MRISDRIGLSAFVVSVCAAVLAVPELSWQLVSHPTFAALAAGVAMLNVVVVLRASGRRGSLVEQRMFAVFLVLMPTVYLASWLRAPGSAAWLAVELAGQGVFVALAILGLRRSPGWLAGGIAMHGLGWDAWHHGRSGFMPNWYAVACTVVDVGAGLYVASQVTAWEQARQPAATPRQAE